MKNTLLIPLLFTAFLLNLNISFGQCTPDPNCTDPDGDGEYCPTEFPYAIEDEYYEEVLTIIAPANVQGIAIHHIDLISLTNIPPGMTYECQDGDCSFWPGAAKCVNISGTPDVDSWGTYYLHMTIETFMDVAGFPVSLGEMVDSSAYVVIQPQLYADFSLNYIDNYTICKDEVYEVTYAGNATVNGTYNWDFGQNIEVISGAGQGPYEIIYNDYYGADSIKLEVQEDIYTSPAHTEVFTVVVCESTIEKESILFSIQPNPFSDYVEISTANTENLEIEIFDISGQLVHRSLSNQNRIDLSHLKKGIYFLSIISPTATETAKIIKR